jgi:deaminated glutathione amidase
MSKAAALQMASGPSVDSNLQEAKRLIAAAAGAGAKLIVLPENFAMMGKDSDLLTVREQDGSGKIQDFLAEEASRHRVWIVGGTIPMECPQADRVYAACLVYDSSGRRAARYNKIHLFDVTLESSGERYQESGTITHGREVVTCETPFGRLGLSVCYDLRFPELFRALLDRGAEIITLPAAFTAITGKAHWETLIRARAIENLAYIVASAQGGYHLNGRETHGDSMIVDPWGLVLDRLPRGNGAVLADIDLARQAATRRNFPCIEHRKFKCEG